MALGFASVQVFSPAQGTDLAGALRVFGHGVTELRGKGQDGPVDLILSVVKRRDLPTVRELINDLAPEAFVSIEEPTAIQHGWTFPKRRK